MSIDPREQYSNLLKQAMVVDPSLSERTRAEQEAGRDRLMNHLRMSIVDVGVEALQKRFTKKALPGPGGLQFKNGEWVASIYVNTASKAYIGFEEPLTTFPSDHMIAQIALVT